MPCRVYSWVDFACMAELISRVWLSCFRVYGWVVFACTAESISACTAESLTLKISQDLPGISGILTCWHWRYTEHHHSPLGPGDGLKKFLAMKSKAISRPSAHRVSSSLTSSSISSMARSGVQFWTWWCDYLWIVVIMCTRCTCPSKDLFSKVMRWWYANVCVCGPVCLPDHVKTI